MDWKAIKKTVVLAAVGLLFGILYFSLSTLGLHPMIEALLKTPLAVLAIAPMVGAAAAIAVVGVRYLYVVRKAVDRDKDYTENKKKADSKKKSREKKATASDLAKEEEHVRLQEERLAHLVSLWKKEELTSPASDLLRYYDAITNGTHEQYLESVSADETPENTIYAAFSLLPSPLKENLARAYAAKNEEFDDLSLDTILTECDELLHKNQDLLRQALLALGDKILTKETENTK